MYCSPLRSRYGRTLRGPSNRLWPVAESSSSSAKMGRRARRGWIAARAGRASATCATDAGVRDFMMAGSRTGATALSALAGFAAGRGAAVARTTARDLALAGLATLARIPGILGLRAADLAALRAAGALRAATFATGFLVLEIF